ncbi:hypothetical protein [Parasedimentitalea psychrophila]|uniref:Uncharacterized protein n=1 Tax=Parasedimentitalea psychrophila TaxID=2997337 RepID=A0A9Y2P2Z2_9RHOB|nr:hypothetical protein [Parasedimentitalea psychrophila]WIY25547.1 hypothetical protein QPJ95_00900 [Parasedimentitalea psychrophila]
MNVVKMGLAAVIVSIGSLTVKFVNENYETIRDYAGINAISGFVFAGVLMLLFGIFMMGREFFRWSAGSAQAAAPQRSANVEQPVRQTSNRAKLIFSLLGFSFGMIAMLVMFMSAAAQFIETEKADLAEGGGILIAALLVIVSALIGMVGLFLRGYALGRVPVYFVIGAGLTITTVRLLRINMLEWQFFTVLLQ